LKKEIKKKWVLKTGEAKLPPFLKEYPPLVGRFFLNRGFKSKKEIENFLNPVFEENLHSPSSLLGLKEGVKRIGKAIAKKERITIFGDYDADGVCGAAILETVLRKLGAVVGPVYIPDRYKEGYGLNEKAIRQIAGEGTKLIITVDCGVANFKEVVLANELGLAVVITDHHQAPEILPPALALINPHQKGDKYPFKDLAGAGVAFKLAHALLEEFKVPRHLNFLKWQLDLVALATAADCVPLKGENRVLVKYGLLTMAQTKNVGLKALFEVARICPTFNSSELCTNLNVFSLSFSLAPRINAAGRMDHANMAYELLMTESRTEAKWLAERLEQKNKERQSETEKMIKRIEKEIVDKMEEPFVCEGGVNFIPGIVGLAAGKIADKYFKPAVIFGESDGVIHGSVRGVKGFNVMNALRPAGSLFLNYGGHPAAAGFSMLSENLEEFKKVFKKGVLSQKTSLPEPSLEIDDRIELSRRQKTNEIWASLRLAAPFGQGNEEPIFLAENLKVANLKLVGNGNGHLKLELEGVGENPDLFEAIGFSLGSRAGEIKIGDKLDVVFKFLEDEWNGVKKLSLKLVDFKKN